MAWAEFPRAASTSARPDRTSESVGVASPGEAPEARGSLGCAEAGTGTGIGPGNRAVEGTTVSDTGSGLDGANPAAPRGAFVPMIVDVAETEFAGGAPPASATGLGCCRARHARPTTSNAPNKDV